MYSMILDISEVMRLRPVGGKQIPGLLWRNPVRVLAEPHNLVTGMQQYTFLTTMMIYVFHLTRTTCNYFFCLRMVHPLARKSRATQLAFRNRRATFEVYYRKKKGWLAPKPELFGKAVLPLVGLLHSCELEEQLRLRSGHRGWLVTKLN